MSTGLTHSQLYAIEITERVCSILSLVGTSFIIVTFLCCNAFHKPINRLVFYAAFGNILANVGTLISRSGIVAGGRLCQFQGFLIQMFMPADAFWTLAMACNVYLTFFRKYDAKALRALEWKYLLICYGGPLIPAFVYFFIHTKDRGKVYGDAVLWCWIDIKWDFLRIALFYAPVWAVLFITLAIYIHAGNEIFEKRNALKKFSGSQDMPFTMIQNPFAPTKTTEVHVTSEPAIPADSALGTEVKAGTDFAGAHNREGYNPYSVTIETGGAPFPPRSSSVVVLGVTSHAERPRAQKSPAMEANKAAFGYARVAILFFAAILVTWVPSTVNRVYSLVRPDSISYPLNFVSALVLPLQGFWNSVIYTFTTLPACRVLWRDMMDSLFPGSRINRHAVHANKDPSRQRTGGKTGLFFRDQDSLTESDSTKGFARE